MKNNCPKCEGNMVKGYITDRTYMNMAKKQAWTEGEKAKVTRKSKDVVAYRCEQCGYLELYTE